MILEYDTLKFIWWLFVVVLLVGFALLDGFDLGIGTLLPFLGANDAQRRVMINTIGPTWEGNQVWFITAGGALFAAWPFVYAAAFSGLYFALMMVLFALILRPVGFDFRSKLPDPRWRNTWDWGLFIGGCVPALVFGVAIGNLLQGLPFHYDNELRPIYTGSFFALFDPFSLLCGITSVAMVTMHGATFLMLRTEAELNAKARSAALRAAAIFLAGFILAGIWMRFGIDGFRIIDMPDPSIGFHPLQKQAEIVAGAWFNNFSHWPLLWLAPLAGVAGAVLVMLLVRGKANLPAFLASGLSVAGCVVTPAVAMFPFVMPSRTDPGHSLTMWDATSSHLTLQWMFLAAVVFLPIIIVYTSWTYRVLRGKVTEDDIKKRSHSAY